MADSSNTRLDAAAKAIQAAWVEATHPYYTVFASSWSYAEQAYTLADIAIAAIDDLERPAVERLVAALATWIDEQIAGLERSTLVPASEGAIAAFEQTRHKLAEFGQQPTGDADGS